MQESMSLKYEPASVPQQGASAEQVADKQALLRAPPRDPALARRPARVRRPRSLRPGLNLRMLVYLVIYDSG